MKLIVGLSGASGAIFGVRLLEELQKKKVETHLVVSEWARYTLKEETVYSVEDLKDLSSCFYEVDDLAAPIASGTFKGDGMIIAPCSMKTLASIAYGFTDNLLSRAADVTLKEGRKLVLLARETPLNVVHLENMLKLARLGVVIMPPVPAFYAKPKDLQGMINQTIGRVCDLFGLETEGFIRWKS